MSIWLVPRSELTLEQLRAVELDPKSHRVVMGGPGSGKTLVLLHRAQYLREKLHVDESRFHIFVYTNVLKEYLRSALSLLNLPESCVSNLDSWCYSYFRRNIRRPLPRNGKQIDFMEIRSWVLEDLKKNGQNRHQYEFIMVDEGQDMNDIAYEIFKIIAKHITVCLDGKQQLYEVGSTEQEILKELGVPACNVNLLEGYRCSPYIVKLAARLIKEEKERDAYIRQTRTRSTDIETPVLFYAKNREEEKERLISIIQTRLLNNERIAVLFPKKKQVYGYAAALREAGLEVEDMDGLDFNKETPKLMTYHSAKGLTFDTVIMPRLVRSSFFKVAEDVVERQVFIALTRATKWVYMSTVEGEEIACLRSFAGLADDGNITIRKSQEKGPNKFAENNREIKDDTGESEIDDSDLLDII